MSFSFRVFRVDDDGTICRIPLAAYQRLQRRDPNSALRTYCGQTVKLALIYLELRDRRAIRVVSADYPRQRVDSEGYFDQSQAIEEGSRTAAVMDVILAGSNDDAPRQRIKFVEKRHRFEFEWQPSPELEQRLMSAALA